jgi:hypothetical protein
MSTTSILTAKSMAELFLPPIFGVGLAVFKGLLFNGYAIDSLPMYIEIGTTTASFIITDIIGDVLGATEQYDNGTFGKTMEAILLEPILFGGMYSAAKEMLMPNVLYKVGFVAGTAEGALTYASARFFADPFIAMFNTSS